MSHDYLAETTDVRATMLQMAVLQQQTFLLQV
jgi:hypothetical protein